MLEPRDARGEDEGARQLEEDEQAIHHVVVVVGRGEPAEVHPGPPHPEEDHRVGEDPRADVAFGQGVVQPARGLGHRHHDHEVEEELEGRRGPVVLVGRACLEGSRPGPVAMSADLRLRVAHGLSTTGEPS